MYLLAALRPLNGAAPELNRVDATVTLAGRTANGKTKAAGRELYFCSLAFGTQAL